MMRYYIILTVLLLTVASFSLSEERLSRIDAYVMCESQFMKWDLTITDVVERGILIPQENAASVNVRGKRFFIEKKHFFLERKDNAILRQEVQNAFPGAEMYQVSLKRDDYGVIEKHPDEGSRYRFQPMFKPIIFIPFQSGSFNICYQ